jgi:poly [ADP-ribose] polymerase
VPKSINDQDLLKKELELVDALGDMQVAQKLISASIPRDDAGNPVNPLDARFRGLGLSSMDPVDRQSTEFAALDKYVQDTHGETHRHYKVAIQHVFRVER